MNAKEALQMIKNDVFRMIKAKKMIYLQDIAETGLMAAKRINYSGLR